MDNPDATLIALSSDDELHTLLAAVQSRYIALGRYFFQQADRLAILTSSVDPGPERFIEELRRAAQVLEPWQRA